MVFGLGRLSRGPGYGGQRVGTQGGQAQARPSSHQPTVQAQCVAGGRKPSPQTPRLQENGENEVPVSHGSLVLGVLFALSPHGGKGRTCHLIQW